MGNFLQLHCHLWGHLPSLWFCYIVYPCVDPFYSTEFPVQGFRELRAFSPVGMPVCCVPLLFIVGELQWHNFLLEFLMLLIMLSYSLPLPPFVSLTFCCLLFRTVCLLALPSVLRSTGVGPCFHKPLAPVGSAPPALLGQLYQGPCRGLLPKFRGMESTGRGEIKPPSEGAGSPCLFSSLLLSLSRFSIWHFGLYVLQRQAALCMKTLGDIIICFKSGKKFMWLAWFTSTALFKKNGIGWGFMDTSLKKLRNDAQYCILIFQTLAPLKRINLTMFHCQT